MSDVLYYPNYSPNKKQTRSLLLFYDHLNLIVPWKDQIYVRNRPHIWEISEVNNRDVNFIDPFSYSGWTQDRHATKLFAELIEKEIESGRNAFLQPYNLDRDGFARIPNQFIEQLVSAGWHVIAWQKIPEKIAFEIFRNKVGMRIGTYRDKKTGAIYEHDALVLLPNLADFILTRLAREISNRNGLPSITFSDLQYKNHTFHKYIRANDFRHDMVSVFTNLIIPKEINILPHEAYMSVRTEFSGIRRALHTHIDNVSKIYAINENIETDRYLRIINDSAGELDNQIREAEKILLRRDRLQVVNFGIGLASTVMSAAFGTAIQDMKAAMGLATCLHIGQTAVSNFLVGGRTDNANPEIETFAMLRGRIKATAKPYGSRSA